MSDLLSDPTAAWTAVAAVIAMATISVRPRPPKDTEPTKPMRGELLSVDRLEQLAAELAAEHRVAPREAKPSGANLLARLSRNQRRLAAAHKQSAKAVDEGRAISPAAEWLLDNYHIVQEQLREAREDLPRRYYAELPKLAGGDLAGAPRVYALAVELITHTDSRLDAETLSRFVAAYQRNASLTLGELWAVPIALRLALIENLGRLAARIVRAHRERTAADALADRLIEIAGDRPDAVASELDAKVSGRVADTTPMFAVELLLRIRDQDPALAPVVTWLEERLSAQGTTVEETTRAEHQSQAANQVSVGNIIGSMRMITAADWPEFVESLSLVEATLSEDPLGYHARQDFATRDRYRHEVERIAKRTRLEEVDVARRAVAFAREAGERVGADPRTTHVGYYLVDRGLAALERAANYRPTVRERATRAVLARPTLVYLGSIAVMTIFFVTLLVLYAWQQGAGWVDMLLVALVAALPASDLAASVVNSEITHTLAPRRLGKLDLSKGVPPEYRTFVVVPTMLTSPAGVKNTFDHLEVQYLANADPNVHFAVLSDFADAGVEQTPNDAEVIEAATAAVRELNARYGDGREDRFYLLHRKRLWNEREGKWMGWERKRGKLSELNRLFAGARDTTFSTVVGDTGVFASVRYVITLDADTILPRDTARKLVGTLAHPLNEARLDPKTRRVVEGYAILQPRVSATLESSSQSGFASIFSGNTGVDPYTTAVSDVYQDLFGEGSYTGKGIYDPRVFEEALDGRIPENQLLSHDLFEGSYARAGLVSDIELFDDCPSSYLVHSMRRHRWTRGDWQLLPWLGPRVPRAGGGRERNVLPAIMRWKMFDNLRRSLVAPALVLMLVAGWLCLPGQPLLWALAVAVVLAFPIYTHLTTSVMNGPGQVQWSSYFWSVWSDLATNTGQVALTIVFLPHQAWVSLDAIMRSLWRHFVSRRQMLEWVTAAQAEQVAARTLGGVVTQMWPALAFTLLAALGVALVRPVAWAEATGFLVAWLLSPAVALWVSRTRRRVEPVLTDIETTYLRRTARKTWRFFETFMTDEDHWLPPDNFQEDPGGVVAHRTSPTNIGLALLTNFAAHDLGYRGLLETVERVELTLDTMEKLERFHGHLYNWYDTATLAPLWPRYISSVDSGNLAGHLIALKQACVEAIERPLLGPEILSGLQDALMLLDQETARLSRSRGASGGGLVRRLRGEIESLAPLLGPVPASLDEWIARLDAVGQQAHAIAEIVHELSLERENEDLVDLKYWAGAIVTQTMSHARDLKTLAPWAALLAQRPEGGELPQVFERGELLSGSPSAADLWERADALVTAIPATRAAIGHGSTGGQLSTLEYAATVGENAAMDLLARLDRAARRADAFALAMDFAFLFDTKRELFSIGYNVHDSRLDNSYYDLLASEARLASFVAIAKGDIPERHWFRLGRPLAPVDGHRSLLSWSGSMFEYAMPLLVMRSYAGTLLDQTVEAAIARQVEYAKSLSVPWGISEAAYNTFDVSRNYQYGPFGVPGLGIKRRLGDDLVVAPYATALATIVTPKAAVANFDRLSKIGLDGRYGFYESIDYTPERNPVPKQGVIVRAYMAHHQGMSLLAINESLNGSPMRRRFHADPIVQATDLLLQERIPHGVRAAELAEEDTVPGRMVRNPAPDFTRHYGTTQHSTPRIHLLSNGSYSVMVTTAGGGYSRRKNVAVTRWREDVTRDDWGQFCYVRDVESGEVWSTGLQPVGRAADTYEVTYSLDKAEFRRRDTEIETHMEISVSTEDDAEVRRLTITNHSGQTRLLDVTTYFEVVLAPAAADVAHPAFGNLFVQTEYVPRTGALLATRRARSERDTTVWGVHVSAVDGRSAGGIQYETDRARFLGRGRTAANAISVVEDRPLSETVGSVLDPIMSLRRTVRIAPGESARLLFTTAVADSRDEALALAEKYADIAAALRALELAWTNAHVELRYLTISTEEAHLFLRLASRLVYVNPDLRARPEVIARNTRGQSGLWAYGVSGDLPIVLVRISDVEQVDLVRQLLRAHEFWRLRGLAADLVILNEHPSSYRQELHEALLATVRSSPAAGMLDKPGGIFVRRTDVMPDEDRILFMTVARAVLVGGLGSLEQQIERKPRALRLPPEIAPPQSLRPRPHAPVPRPQLEFFNGLGGFARGGREYVTVLGDGQSTPAPWSNVIANEWLGFIVSESGGGYTWNENSRENRLTPWSNDPVSDAPGEVVYVRDEETGEIWTPTPLPIRGHDPYTVRHGQGYTVFETTTHGVEHEMTLFVAPDDPVKVIRLRLRNAESQRRSLSVTFYAEWVLGVLREASAPFVVTSVDEQTGALFARNPYNNEFAHKIAFADSTPRPRSFTAERKEFVGRNGSLARPRGLLRQSLSGRAGAGYDPCAALQVAVTLPPGEQREVVFILGETDDVTHARALVTRYRAPSAASDAFSEAVSRWEDVLGRIEIETPDKTMDAIVNRWLLYQTLCCRVWARAAFYQSGGAYGFRDQLQDVAALVYARPEVAREQILRAAAHQFVEGDVQHWWHPPTGRGVRTRFSDDLLWLPLVVARYVTTTGDAELLDEAVPFVEARKLGPGEEDAYLVPEVSDERAAVYEHCLRALDRSLGVGAHGLPLMGAGDWNDGMNRVGQEGKGESVWLAWFLTLVLKEFAPICEARGDTKRAEIYREHADRLRATIEQEAWDGEWYVRAFFDDGTPLGSSRNEECRIDSIAQSWSVISGAGDPHRRIRAMAAVEQHLVRRGDGLIMLFTPPFDKTHLDPGYIKGYVPGVRENGGQYTHAAVWTVMAYAMLGDGDRAGELFALLNPVNHAATRSGVHRYKVEPYVAAADVYAVPPHTGRGGWTWYTGSAGWMYRVAIESILGFSIRDGRLHVDPCIPRSWPSFGLTYRHGTTRYRIRVENPTGVCRGVLSVEFDGEPVAGPGVPLVEDGREHAVRIVIGEPERMI